MSKLAPYYYIGLDITLDRETDSPYVEVYKGDLRFTKRRPSIAVYEKATLEIDPSIAPESNEWYREAAEEIALQEFIRKATPGEAQGGAE